MEGVLDANLVIMVLGAGLLITVVCFLIWSLFKSWFFLVVALLVAAILLWFSFKNFDFSAATETFNELLDKVFNRSIEQ